MANPRHGNYARDQKHDVARIIQLESHGFRLVSGLEKNKHNRSGPFAHLTMNIASAINTDWTILFHETIFDTPSLSAGHVCAVGPLMSCYGLSSVGSRRPRAPSLLMALVWWSREVMTSTVFCHNSSIIPATNYAPRGTVPGVPWDNGPPGFVTWKWSWIYHRIIYTFV